VVKKTVTDKLKKVKVEEIEDCNYNVLQVELILKSTDILIDKMQSMLSPYLNDLVLVLANLKNKKLQSDIKQLIFKVGQCY